MNAQEVMIASRLAGVRDLREQVARLRAENAALRDENEELRSHLAVAALAARDLARLPEGGRMVVVDGWNLVLSAQRLYGSLDELVAAVKRRLEARTQDFAWIVLDGDRENSREEGRLRITYTGGKGRHRADRLVCDFLRMARLSGDVSRIEVVTFDKDFRDSVGRLGGASNMSVDG